MSCNIDPHAYLPVLHAENDVEAIYIGVYQFNICQINKQMDKLGPRAKNMGKMP
jgi:hypothetical protein